MFPLEVALVFSVVCAVSALAALLVRRPEAKIVLGTLAVILAVVCAMSVRAAYVQSGGPDESSDHWAVVVCYAAVIAAGGMAALRGTLKRRKAKRTSE